MLYFDLNKFSYSPNLHCAGMAPTKAYITLHSRQIPSGKINQEWDLSLELSARRHVAEDNYKHDLPWVYVDLVKGES